MRIRLTAVLGAAAFIAATADAQAVDVVPHRALYIMSLESAKPSSGVVGANGTLAYQWGETCDGWTIEQRYKLNMQYEEDPAAEIGSAFVTWEAKDGLGYRFNERKTRNGQLEEEIRGDATLNAKDHAGTANFVKPKEQSFDLPSGSFFPTAHTLTLIRKGEAGESFLAAPVFDGSEFDGAVLISAVIGPKAASGAALPVSDVNSPLLQRPSWKMRLAFFPQSSKDERPDYELAMRMLDSGISSEMVIDYGDYVVRAKLKELTALTKPAC
jgi:EipB-like